MAKRDNLRKIADIANEGSRYANLQSAKKVAIIQERFDDTMLKHTLVDSTLQVNWLPNRSFKFFIFRFKFVFNYFRLIVYSSNK